MLFFFLENCVVEAVVVRDCEGGSNQPELHHTCDSFLHRPRPRQFISSGAFPLLDDIMVPQTWIVEMLCLVIHPAVEHSGGFIQIEALQ